MVGTELKTDKLPSVPEVLLKLVAACRKPLVSLDEVVSIVKHDAALSARVIAMGSARSHPEKSIRRASGPSSPIWVWK